MANHEGFSSGTENDSLNLWRSELNDAEKQVDIAEEDDDGLEKQWLSISNIEDSSESKDNLDVSDMSSESEPDDKADLPTDSVDLLRKISSEESTTERSATDLLGDALSENDPSYFERSRKNDIEGLEKAERFSKLRKFGDKLLSIFSKREATNKAERREAQRELAGKIGAATLKVAEKVATTAATVATQTVLTSMGLGG